MIIKTNTHIYAIELKLDSTSQKAIEQILDKGYLRPYILDARKKVAVGINFSSEKRMVENYQVKEI